jgi:preprotein translocase subunit YajC
MHLLLSALLLLAQSGDGSGSAPAAEPPSLFNPIFLLPIGFILIWLFLLRPGQKRREREQQAMTANLVKNDKVLTTASIIGIVHSVQDDEVVLKLEDNAKVRLLKAAIIRNYSAEERQKNAAAASAPPASTAPNTDEAIKEKNS